jgi:hypothetical protein
MVTIFAGPTSAVFNVTIVDDPDHRRNPNRQRGCEGPSDLSAHPTASWWPMMKLHWLRSIRVCTSGHQCPLNTNLTWNSGTGLELITNGGFEAVRLLAGAGAEFRRQLLS